MDVGHLNPNDSTHSTSPLAHPEQNAPPEDLLNGTPLADAEPTEQPPAPAVAERSQSLSIPSYLSWAACSTLSLPVTATKLCYAGGCAAINYITNPQQHVDLRNAVANADADPIMQVKQIIKNNPRVKANVPDSTASYGKKRAQPYGAYTA